MICEVQSGSCQFHALEGAIIALLQFGAPSGPPTWAKLPEPCQQAQVRNDVVEGMGHHLLDGGCRINVGLSICAGGGAKQLSSHRTARFGKR